MVSDITPLAFDFAAAAGLPSVGSSHFTWDWIYEPYVALHPDYHWLLGAIRESYARATLALEMPFAHDFSVFPRVERIPLVVRALTFTRDQIRAAFGVPEGKRLAVLSMGGMDWGEAPLAALRAHADWVFVLPPDRAALAEREPNLRAVPPDYRHFHDLTAARRLADRQGGRRDRLGVHRLPDAADLLLPQRTSREDELLRPALAEYAHARLYDKAPPSRPGPGWTTSRRSRWTAAPPGSRSAPMARRSRRSASWR